MDCLNIDALKHFGSSWWNLQPTNFIFKLWLDFYLIGHLQIKRKDLKPTFQFGWFTSTLPSWYFFLQARLETNFQFGWFTSTCSCSQITLLQQLYQELFLIFLWDDTSDDFLIECPDNNESSDSSGSFKRGTVHAQPSWNDIWIHLRFSAVTFFNPMGINVTPFLRTKCNNARARILVSSKME